MSRIGRLLVVALMLGLAACGWRLRGQGGISLQGVELYVEMAAAAADLRAPVARGIRASGAGLADAREAADAVLVLLGETVRQRPASVSADARVQEYELAYSLRYRLETPDGQPLIPPEAVRVSEIYRDDGSNVLSTESRAATVTERLRRDAVRLLLPRVQAALANRAQG
jgi:LPS-assembly lipoprotein